MLKFISGNCLSYLSKVCQFAPEGNISLRDDFFKLNRPFWNTNTSQKALFFIGPSFWNQIPETLKKAGNLDTFSHILKKHFFNQMTWFLLTLLLLLLSLSLLLSITIIAIIIMLLLLGAVVLLFYQYCYWGTTRKIKLFACFVLSLLFRFINIYIYIFCRLLVIVISNFFVTKVCNNCFLIFVCWSFYNLHGINFYNNFD